MRNVDLIGLHGQTVFHERRVATLQIGEPSYLAMKSRKKVISNFRVADIAVGGEGAPLASFFHQVVFGQKKKSISLHNLGGISNLSLIVNGQLKLGFDTGPANMLIDEQIRVSSKFKKFYDKDGSLAAKGKINFSLLGEMLKHEYFRQAPPKSCGREQFGKLFYEKFNSKLLQMPLENRLCTLTELTVQSIVKAYIQFSKPMPSEISVCGGGSKNIYVLQRITQELEGIKISTVEDYEWPTQSIEAAAFALLAACCVWRIPANVPAVTSAKRKVVLGQITEL
jgi:anhydro-N-acetylmuramic acid kinase